MEKSEYLRMYTLESDFWWYKVLHELVDSTIGRYKPEGPISILDAGCGTGRMLEINQKYGTVTGIDYSEDAVTYAKKRGLDNIFIGDLNNYPFEKNTYEVVVCLDVLYHSAIENDLAVVDRLRESLKNDGILIINVPAFDFLKRSHDQVVHTKKRYRRKVFVDELKAAGFSVLRSGYRMPHLFFIILLSKLISKEKVHAESESDLKEIPSWLNKLLFKCGRFENWCIRRGIVFPLGSSLFIVAKKVG